MEGQVLWHDDNHLDVTGAEDTAIRTNNPSSNPKDQESSQIVQSDLIAQLRRGLVPQYFSESDVEALSEKVAKTVKKVLNKQ